MTDKFTQRFEEFTAAYAALFALLADYPAERGETPGACGYWTPRQVLAHLDGWIAEANRRYDDFDAGKQPDVDYSDFDNFNADSVNARAHLTWEQQIASLRAAYFALRARAEAVPQDAREANAGYRGWLRGLGADCAAHTVQLREFLEAKG